MTDSSNRNGWSRRAVLGSYAISVAGFLGICLIAAGSRGGDPLSFLFVPILPLIWALLFDFDGIVRNLIAANQAGVPLSSYELEQAYLQGCDLEKLVLAMIEANKRGLNITWQEAVDADLHGRLQEKLKKGEHQ